MQCLQKEFESMKRKVIVIALIVVALAMVLVGCNNTDNYDGKTKIVYELEGGSYKNCTAPIVQYYDFADGTQNLIYSPQLLSRMDVERPGYRFTGWFKTRTQDGDRVTYSDEWDFESDKVTTEGIKLYAGWKALVTYTYNVCYVDDSGETKSLGVYDVNEGDEFNDHENFASYRPGNYTPFVYEKDGVQVGYYLDKDCTQSVVGYKHPGGDADLQIDVYVKYIEGRFALVSTADELLSSDTMGRNVYLLNDIDLGGKAFRVESYSRIFEGNGHKIYNFTMPYRAAKNDLRPNIDGVGVSSVYAYIFGNLNGATIKNVSFEGITFTVDGGLPTLTDIYVAPFAKEVVNSTIENVSVDMTYAIASLPSKDFNVETNFEVFETGYVKIDNSTITNLSVTVTENK